MNWIRKIAITTMLIFAMAAAAQQMTTKMPSVDEHLKVLSAKLDLTADQQAKIRPILEEIQASAEKVMEDPNLTADARHEKLRALHVKAAKEAREYLSTEQQEKMDAMMQEPHPDAH
ncbi:MAG TPA: hypothetical protein VGL89_17385 [Candidatus Koribacter sp.]|jgi:DNA-binding protein YbaB